ncbi:MAG: HU family DNA-binding protein [Patescibacteria group bacterium]|nr:HU family DNA-binding protein [Patescibacteria group bacterium]
MNKGELVEAVAKKVKMPKAQIQRVLDETLGTVKKNMKTKKVQLIGFGTFESVRRKKRQGVNPATGKKITIPAKRVPKFRPGQAMKDAVK